MKNNDSLFESEKKLPQTIHIDTIQGGAGFLSSVKWVGSRCCDVNPYQPSDIAGYPVRVVKGALGENVPYKDLLVMPEHCFYFDGQFIPARMLVNGTSIRYDHSITSYEYYHVELEDHSVIMANGAFSESYLNTSNHSGFYHDNNVENMPVVMKTWEHDAAAPLVTERSIVEKFYHQFEDRAVDLGMERREGEVSTTMDPDLHLVTDRGEVIYPRGRRQDGRYVFAVSSHVNHICIQSLSSRPCDSIGSFVDDRRDLGVLVGEVLVSEGGSCLKHIDQHLQNTALSGWHAWENGRCRWTMGNAMLSLESLDKNSDLHMIVMEIVAAGPYLLEKNELSDKLMA